MIDTLGIFFTHSAADSQWPDLAKLLCPDNPTNRQRRETVVANPALADWYFYQQVHLYMKHYYVDTLGACDYWLRFEWQHRGSPHVHVLAWLTKFMLLMLNPYMVIPLTQVKFVTTSTQSFAQ